MPRSGPSVRPLREGSGTLLEAFASSDSLGRPIYFISFIAAAAGFFRVTEVLRRFMAFTFFTGRRPRRGTLPFIAFIALEPRLAPPFALKRALPLVTHLSLEQTTLPRDSTLPSHSGGGNAQSHRGPKKDDAQVTRKDSHLSSVSDKARVATADATSAVATRLQHKMLEPTELEQCSTYDCVPLRGP